MLTPQQAVSAAEVLSARQIVPIHYGVKGAPGYQELPVAEESLVAAAQRRSIGVEIAKTGEWLAWSPKH